MSDLKLKSVTFSFDDAALQDIRLAQLFRKYNLRATFNVNSRKLGEKATLIRDGFVVNHTKMDIETAKKTYEGFEVASHTLTHPDLAKRSENEIIFQVEEDRKNLKEIFGYEIDGFVFPGGRACRSDEVYRTVREKTNIKYARDLYSTYSFDFPKDLKCFNPTISCMQFEKLFELGHKFVNMKPDKPQLFYIWGHSFEFDLYDRWEHFEQFLQLISNREDIFYGTNSEVFGLVNN